MFINAFFSTPKSVSLRGQATGAKFLVSDNGRGKLLNYRGAVNDKSNKKALQRIFSEALG